MIFQNLNFIKLQLWVEDSMMKILNIWREFFKFVETFLELEIPGNFPAFPHWFLKKIWMFLLEIIDKVDKTFDSHMYKRLNTVNQCYT